MPNDNQGNHPGEEHHYEPKLQNPNYQDLPVPNYTGSPIPQQDQQIIDYAPPPPPIIQQTSNLGPGTKLYERPPKPKSRAPIVIALLLVTTLLFLATTIFAFTRPNSTTIPQKPPATHVIQQPTTAPTNVTSTGVATPSSTATQQTSPSPATTPQTGASVASGTITENLQLTCGANCNDPIHVTITTIQVDDGNGNMTWNISLKNVSGSSMSYGINTFELLASGTQTQIPITFPQSTGTLANSDPMSIQGIFSFVPVQNTTYTLTAGLEENPFMGPQITFDPVQITNL